MAKQIVYVLCALLVITNAKVLTPRDLADEAREQVQELSSIVQSEILVAHDNLDNLITDWRANSINVAQAGTLEIHQEEGIINSQLNSIKALANSANVDISFCTDVREEVLDSNAAVTAASDGRYLVDVIINKVHDLENQIRRCRDDILCILPLLTQIQLDKVRLPQSIKTEVQAIETLLTSMRLSVRSCSDDNVAGYISEAYSILNDIATCVNIVLG